MSSTLHLNTSSTPPNSCSTSFDHDTSSTSSNTSSTTSNLHQNPSATTSTSTISSPPGRRKWARSGVKTPYSFFMDTYREEVKRRLPPTSSAKEVRDELRSRWEALDNKERKKFKIMSKEDAERMKMETINKFKTMSKENADREEKVSMVDIENMKEVEVKVKCMKNEYFKKEDEETQDMKEAVVMDLKGDVKEEEIPVFDCNTEDIIEVNMNDLEELTKAKDEDETEVEESVAITEEEAALLALDMNIVVEGEGRKGASRQIVKNVSQG